MRLRRRRLGLEALPVVVECAESPLSSSWLGVGGRGLLWFADGDWEARREGREADPGVEIGGDGAEI